QRAVPLAEFRARATEEQQPYGPPRPGGKAQHELMLEPGWANVVVVHAGGMPLARAVEVRDLGHAAQITGLVWIRTRRAVPVMRPERVLIIAAVARGDVLTEPRRALAAVQAKE